MIYFPPASLTISNEVCLNDTKITEKDAVKLARLFPDLSDKIKTELKKHKKEQKLKLKRIQRAIASISKIKKKYRK